MSDLRPVRNLALIGFMGTGKSSVGRLVAEQLRFDFVDTDDLITDKVGRSIAEIFAQDGEAAFRAQERAVVKELEERSRLVIATGGGLICDPSNLASLRTHALIVCLWASPAAIWERVRNQTHRPLLQGPDPQAKIASLLAQRGPAYREAGVLVGTDLRSPREVAQQILHHFRLAPKILP
ncbi:MAG TPA: shikimate kinase [Verrucomicrobiae bacterium]|nr:shikimate kinase [Verrucomicrobiae bacterium]